MVLIMVFVDPEIRKKDLRIRDAIMAEKRAKSNPPGCRSDFFNSGRKNCAKDYINIVNSKYMKI